MADILLEISRDYGISFEELNARYGVRMDDADEHRCTAINKNGKRCVKMRRDGCDVCAIHYNSQKRVETQATDNQSGSREDTSGSSGTTSETTRERAATRTPKRVSKEKMIDTATLLKQHEASAQQASSSVASSSSGGIVIHETEKKRGIYPEKVKKISYSGRNYYMNKTGWIYEMNQEDEMILSDIPIGKMMNERIVRLNYM
jgi:hypothetical protein